MLMLIMYSLYINIKINIYKNICIQCYSIIMQFIFKYYNNFFHYNIAKTFIHIFYVNMLQLKCFIKCYKTLKMPYLLC